MKQLRVGLLGCGNVGAALVTLLDEQRAVIAARTGIDLEITRIAVRSVSKARDLHVSPSVFCSNAADIVADPKIDIVVEVIGGIEPARTLLRQALTAKKPAVTANKELLANHGAELFAAAEEVGVDLLFEAAVAGAIPLIRPLRESLAAEPIQRIMGIVNGTTNYILTRMAEQGADFAEALSEAQSLGYAERDPSADIEGFDAGAKAAIIATVAFGAEVVAGDVYHEGITRISSHDIEMAHRLGYVVKAIAVAERTPVASPKEPGPPEVAVRVHPAMLPLQHPLAGVRDSFNAVFVQGDAVGELMFYGRGAGGRPTAGAVLGDLVDAAVNLSSGASGRIGRLVPAKIRSIDDLRSAYYLSLEVADKPGVLASVAAVLGHHNVSIRSMEQHGLGDDARLVFITHECRERDLQSTLRGLRDLEAVHELGNVIRVVGHENLPQ